MHLTEFKAWFEGFTEEMEKPPNDKQWKKIRARVKDITADYTPAPVFIDRYYTPYRRYWGAGDLMPGWATASYTAGNVSGTTSNTIACGVAQQTELSIADWKTAGRAEYLAKAV